MFKVTQKLVTDSETKLRSQTLCHSSCQKIQDDSKIDNTNLKSVLINILILVDQIIHLHRDPKWFVITLCLIQRTYNFIQNIYWGHVQWKLVFHHAVSIALNRVSLRTEVNFFITHRIIYKNVSYVNGQGRCPFVTLGIFGMTG